MASKKWTQKDLPDLSGRTVVVTGASSGIGLVSARELCAHGARVILAVRNVEKGRDAAQDFEGTYEVRELNLADLESIRAFAAGWSGDLDILINNAGIMMAPAFRTIDDFELHMGTNHLGPFALTNRLLPFITDRVVTVSSILHPRGRIHLDDLHFDSRPYNAMTAYQDSKLANLLFTLELQRRLSEQGSGERAHATPLLAQSTLQFEREQEIGQFRVLIGRHCVVGPRVEVEIVQMNPPSRVEDRGHRDDAVGDEGQQPVRQRERTEVIRAHVQFEVVDGAKGRRHHDAGVVDEHVEVAGPLVGEVPDGFQIGQIQFTNLVGANEVLGNVATLL